MIDRSGADWRSDYQGESVPEGNDQPRSLYRRLRPAVECPVGSRANSSIATGAVPRGQTVDCRLGDAGPVLGVPIAVFFPEAQPASRANALISATADPDDRDLEEVTLSATKTENLKSRDLCRQCLIALMSLVLTFCVTYSDTNVTNSEILQQQQQCRLTEFVKMPALIAKPKPSLLATDREKSRRSS